MFVWPILFNIKVGVILSAIRQEKEVNSMQFGKEELKLSVCRWHDCLCRKFQEIDKKTLLEWINEYSHIADYKVNIKLIASLYTGNKQLEFEIDNYKYL